MKILCVCDEYPWPTRTGYRQRLHWVLKLLSAHAELDILVVLNRPVPDPLPAPPADLPLNRLLVVEDGHVTTPRPARLVRWLLGRSPRVLVGRNWSRARGIAHQWSTAGYDIVWFAHSPLHFALVKVLPAPHIVDLDNLESSYLRHRRLRELRADSTSERARRFLLRVADGLDERRWERLEHAIARRAAATVVCSQLDQRRLGGPRVHVLPNGYERMDDQPPGAEGLIESVLLMVGLMTYEPNRDAAAFFAREVLPLVRAQHPAARFRVVGRYGSEQDVSPLRGLPGVEIVGEVEEITAELRGAAVVVAPIRFGGGTRIKILEALAHSVPVVTTSVGCEGLEVVDGEHLLVADTSGGLAAACLALLVDEQLRSRIGDAGQDLWQRRYRWTRLQPALTDVLQSVAGEGLPDGA